MAADLWRLGATGPDNYEFYQVPSVFEPLARIFLDRIRLKPGERVLDVACGTGIVARLAAPAVAPEGSVVGVDLNADMLAVARRKSAEAGLGIEWRQGEAGSLPCADGGFDAVLCQQGLQFFPDRLGALKEMRRVMADGGRLGLSVWRSVDHSPCHRAIADSLAVRFGPDVVRRFLAIFSFGDEQALRRHVEQVGFSEIEIGTLVVRRHLLAPAQSVPGLLASTPVGPDVAALPAGVRDMIVSEVADRLQEYRDGDGLTVPQATFVVTARK
jgi:ubiquinone/menaquinone biosynthesis C-methylase UbiE